MWKLQPKTIAILCAAALVTACGKDEPGIDPDNGSGSDKPPVIDPNEQVADPEGTVTISMRNENSGKTMLNDMYIDKADNFNGSNGWQFVNLGAMKGLGNVSYIPKSGYADKVSVTPGNGYVAVRPANTYWGIKGGLYRMYVTGYTLDIAGQIIGAEVKYQEPFKGLDEPLRADETALTFTNDGGSQSIVLNNATIIPFTIQSSAPWCRAVPSSTTDHSFLHDAVTIEVESTSVTTTDEAIVTLTTGYKKELSIKVTRAGRDPFLTLNTNSSEITFYDQTINVGVSTNIPSDQLTVTSDADWCTASFTDNVVRMRDKAAKIKYIDGKPATASRSYDEGISSLNLTISATKNLSETQRTAAITVKGQNGLDVKFTITQSPANIILDLANDGLVVGPHDGTYYIGFNSIECPELEVLSDVEWVRGHIEGDKIVVESSANALEESREGMLTLKAVNGTLQKSFYVTQTEGGLFLDGEKKSKIFYLDRKEHLERLNIESTIQYSVRSTEDWCKVYIEDGILNIMVSPSDVIRNCEIVFEGTPIKILVNQTKYAIGDEYTDGKIIGKVGCLGKKSLIVHDFDLYPAYSTQYLYCGATSMDDGFANTKKIQQVPGWEEIFPLFLCAEKLNVDGVTGWYIPAVNQLKMIDQTVPKYLSTYGLKTPNGNVADTWFYYSYSSSTEISPTAYYTVKVGREETSSYDKQSDEWWTSVNRRGLAVHDIEAF